MKHGVNYIKYVLHGLCANMIFWFIFHTVRVGKWGGGTCTFWTTCYTHCRFYNFVGPQPELISEFYRHLLRRVVINEKSENIDENASFFDNWDVYDVIA